MKKIAVIPWLILSMSCCAGQSVRKSIQTIPKLFPVASVIEVEASSRTSWSLAFAYDEKEEKDDPKSGGDAAKDLEKYVIEKPGADWSPRLIAEHTLIAKNHNDLEKLIKVSLFPLFYTETPVRLASRDGGLTLLVASVASKNVYNTLRSEAKERASKEIQGTILPEIKQFQVINSPTIRNFGVIAVYGTKDFSSPDSSPKPELVALVASVENCRKLSQAEITEEDFVAASDIYIVDKDQVTAEVRKVRVSLDK